MAKKTKNTKPSVKEKVTKKERELALKEVSDDMLERLAVVGPPEKVLAKYEALRKTGVTNPVVWLPVGCPPALALETIHTFNDN